MESQFGEVKSFLANKGVEIVKEFEHAETKTSQEAAKYRGVDLHYGAKALLIKLTDKKKTAKFIVVVVCGDESMDSKILRKKLKARGVRFANAEELSKICHVSKGALPPFGEPFELHTIIDENVLKNEKLYFNAGSLKNSLCIYSKDYKEKLMEKNKEMYQVLSFSKSGK